MPAYSATVPANKAVLPREAVGDISATNALKLIFDENGVETGISSVSSYTSGQQSSFLRDMSGRITVYPIRGQVYINATGQKVIFK